VEVLPLHKLLDDSEEPISFSLLSLSGWEPIRIGRRIINQRCEEDGATSGKRPPSPPHMKSARMILGEWTLLSPCGFIDGVQRNCHLDEFALP
jgi:hypothetical protein